MTLPFDVVKTRRQIELGELETRAGKHEDLMAFEGCFITHDAS